MRREINAREEPPSPPKHKDAKVEVRLDPELKERAQEKAKKHGGLSAVIRALLRLWVDENIDPELIGKEHERAPKRRRK